METEELVISTPFFLWKASAYQWDFPRQGRRIEEVAVSSFGKAGLTLEEAFLGWGKWLAWGPNISTLALGPWIQEWRWWTWVGVMLSALKFQVLFNSTNIYWALPGLLPEAGFFRSPLSLKHFFLCSWYQGYFFLFLKKFYLAAQAYLPSASFTHPQVWVLLLLG